MLRGLKKMIHEASDRTTNARRPADPTERPTPGTCTRTRDDPPRQSAATAPVFPDEPRRLQSMSAHAMGTPARATAGESKGEPA